MLRLSLKRGWYEDIGTDITVFALAFVLDAPKRFLAIIR